MPLNKDSKKASILDMMSAFAADNSSADAVWRQALLLRELARDDRAASKQRRAEAVAARAQAEHDAITATKQMCAELQAQARIKFQQAEDALQHAQRVRGDADAQARRLLDEAHAKLERANALKSEADKYAEEIQASARVAAEALLAQARAGAQDIVERMRKETAEEIRKVMAEIEMARSAAEDELETQRILAEAARIRASSPGVAMQAAASGDEARGHTVVEFTRPATQSAAPWEGAAPRRKPAAKRLHTAARKVHTPRRLRKAA